MEVILLAAAGLAVAYGAYALATVPTYDEAENPVSGLGLTPTTFPEVTLNIAENQPEYRPIPAYFKNNPEGEIVTCWKVGFGDRITILFTGRLWLSVWTFWQPLHPMYLSANKRDVLPPVKGESTDNV